MTAEEHAIKFLEMFPDIPNPENCPMTFQYYLRLYFYYLERN